MNWLLGRFKRMGAYWLAIWRHLFSAFVDVFIITVIVLLPLLLARLEPFARAVAGPNETVTFWSIFASGQLALYAIGTTARIAILCLRKGLPETVRVMAGGTCLLTLGFITWLIGIDPKFANAPKTFVGPVTGYVFAVAQFATVFLVALSKMEPADAPAVATAQASTLTSRLQAQNPTQGSGNG
ncbi:MAG: hypothetical protein QOK17_1532 [Sphingomonadales bacterium]|jgi:hypothetical protein|nr:hypothetical protein [Sphingomonadales bacterium]